MENQTASDLTWYCFRTAPQKEVTAEFALRKHGYTVFLPTERRAIRRRTLRRKGGAPKTFTRTYPLMVGYILIGFSGAVNWREMLGTGRETVIWDITDHAGQKTRTPIPMHIGWGHLLKSVVGFEGRPMPLRAGAIEELQERTRQTIPYLSTPNTRRSAQEGEDVRILSGPFADWTGRVEEISDGFASIPVRLFNRTVYRHEPLENIEAA
jgi:hypothetical protein